MKFERPAGVTVCKVLGLGAESWAALIADLERAKPDIFVLNELPFGSWLGARSSFDPAAWKQSYYPCDVT